MRQLWVSILPGMLALSCRVAAAGLALVPSDASPRLFAGAEKSIPVAWRNSGDALVTTQINLRLLQSSSSTVATLGEQPWKLLQVLPGQTVLDRVTLDLPNVQAKTRLLIQWLDDANHLFGFTEFIVYPTNILANLRPLVGANAVLGIFDPGNQLKPLLKAVAVAFEDLETSGIINCHGPIAVIGPFSNHEQAPAELREKIETLARKGVAIVWVQPPALPHDPLAPSYHTVTFGASGVVIAQSSLLANLAESPPSQLNLLHLCREALRPTPLSLPKPKTHL